VTAGPITAGVPDGQTLEPIYLLPGHTRQLRGATFDGTPGRIYTASLDGTVRTYRCRICGERDELEALAPARSSPPSATAEPPTFAQLS